jgi:CRP/FNR family transcriptional regulator
LTAGGPAQALYVLRHGHVRVFRLNDAAAEATTAILGPGQPVGITALLGAPEYHDFAEALTHVEAWVLPAARLGEQLAQHPALGELLIRALVRRLSFETSLLQATTFEPVASRVSTVLGRLSLVDGGERPRLTKEVLAGLVGARRETVSRAAPGPLA